MDYYGYTDYASGALGILGGFFVILIIILLIALAIGIVQTIAFWKIFKKAGKGGWEAIIPYYGNWVLMEISGLNWWWFLMLFAPIVLSFIGLAWLGYLVNAFALFNCYYNLSKRFNKGVGFAICLTLFTPICACILGFSKNEVYNANIEVSNNGVFENSNTSSNTQQPVNPTVAQPVNNQATAPAFCANCGNALMPGAKFCSKCGKQM